MLALIASIRFRCTEWFDAYQRGLLRCSFLLVGQCETPESVGRATVQQPALFYIRVSLFLLFVCRNGLAASSQTSVKMANIFMAQTHFFFPLEKVRRKPLQSLNEQGTPLPLSFTTQRCTMNARFMFIEEQVFYYASQTALNVQCFRKVMLRAYLLSYQMSSEDEEEYFLVVGASIDKCFDESYAHRLPNEPNQSFACRLCTEDDLAFLQEALRRQDNNGLFYPLHDPTQNFRQWVDKIAEKLTNHRDEAYLPEHSIVHVRAVDGILTGITTTPQLDATFNNIFYSLQAPLDFSQEWRGNYTRFTIALMYGNGNMCNISRRQVREFRSHEFSNNRHELTYAGKDGIVFLQSHYPFNISSADEQAKIFKTWPTDLVDVQNVYEMCLSLSMQRRLDKVDAQLGSKHKSYIRTTLAKLSELMGKQYINVRDLNHKYHFILNQMGITATFNHLRNRGELLADAHQLRLSRRTNYIILLFTISAFAVAALQIIQNELNKSSSIMDITIHCDRAPCGHCACECTHTVPNCSHLFWSDSIVLQILFTIIALIILIVAYHFVVYPIIQKLHARLHRDMDN